MADDQLSLKFAIYRGDPGNEFKRNINELDIGSLISALTEEPYHFAKVDQEGSIKIELERTHEWEIIIGLVLIGSGIFLNGAITRLGERFTDWVLDGKGKLGTERAPEMWREGAARIVVNPAAGDETRAVITNMMMEAAQKGLPVLLVMEPGEA